MVKLSQNVLMGQDPQDLIAALRGQGLVVAVLYPSDADTILADRYHAGYDNPAGTPEQILKKEELRLVEAMVETGMEELEDVIAAAAKEKEE